MRKTIVLTILFIALPILSGCINMENEDAKIKVSPTGVSVENDEVKTELGDPNAEVNIEYEDESDKVEIKDGTIRVQDKDDDVQFDLDGDKVNIKINDR